MWPIAADGNQRTIGANWGQTTIFRGNYALGNPFFQSEIECVLGRRERRGSAGLPRFE